MIVNHSTWKNFISNHQSAEWLNSNVELVSAAFSTTKNEADLMGTALGVDPNIFLVLPSDTMQPTLVHHVSKVAKNALIANDTDEFFCLMGWDQSATAIKINPNSFFAAIHDGEDRVTGLRENESKVRKVPTRRLKQAMTVEGFSQCPMYEDEVTVVRKCIPLPPALAKLLLEVNSSEPHQMGHDFARLIFEIERDMTHMNHGFSLSAQNLIDEILTWFYYAPRYPSLRMEFAAAIPGSKVFKAAQELHRAKLSVQNVLPLSDRQIAANVLGNQDNPVLVATIERNTVAIQELTESHRERESDRNQTSSDKGFNKLPTDLQNFLLAAASRDLENPADSIANSGLELLRMSQKTSILSLSRLLKKHGRRFVNLSTSQSNEIVSINWFAPNNPFIGISTCRLPTMAKSFSSASIFEKAQKLELLQKLEIEKQEVFETLTDKSLHRPASTDDVIRNLEIIQSIMEIYLGSECAVVQKISEFIHRIKLSSMKLEYMAASDDELLTKIQYMFDSRLNSWLEDVYENSDNLLDVDHSLIDFMTITQNISHGSFAVSLPLSLVPNHNKLKRPAPEPKETPDDKSGKDPGDQQKQKQKKGATNPEPNPKWKVQDGEAWEMFNKDPNNLRPASVCLMYHIMGHCPLGTKCRRSKSHCKLSNEAQIKQTDAFVEDCRKNARP
jgi:hypothetical protein